MERIATLARKMSLTPNQATALLPTLDTAADSMKMTRDEMVAQCFGNPKVCEYLASICRTVTD